MDISVTRFRASCLMLHDKSRLTLTRPFDIWIRDAAAAGVVQILPLDVEVVIALDGLPASFTETLRIV